MLRGASDVHRLAPGKQGRPAGALPGRPRDRQPRRHAVVKEGTGGTNSELDLHSTLVELFSLSKRIKNHTLACCSSPANDDVKFAKESETQKYSHL